MTRNNCLNILKCIACFGVVFIHITFPGTLGDIVKYASTFAVPLFFMIAGYYSYGCTDEKIKKRVIKITNILVFGILWFLAYNIVFQIKEHTLVTWLANNFNWKTPIKFFAFCTISWAIPLWYLIAMAETYFVWMFVVRFKQEDKVTKFTYVLFFFGALLTVIVDSFGLNWSFKINFICRAMPWFMFGYLVKQKYESKLIAVKNQTLFLIAITEWVITLSAVLLKTTVNYNYVGVLLTAPALFLIGIKNPDISISSPVEYIGEKLSLFIYIFHPLVSSAVMVAMKLLGVNRDGIYTYFHPIVTLAASIAVAIFFELVFRNKKLRRLIYR